MSKFTIVEFNVSQGAIDFAYERESFPTYEAAAEFRSKNYPNKGFFWTGLKEYKIVELEENSIQQTWGCNSLHLAKLKEMFQSKIL